MREARDRRRRNHVHEKDVRMSRSVSARENIQERREMAERGKLRHLRVFAFVQRQLRQNLQHQNGQEKKMSGQKKKMNGRKKKMSR